MSVKIHVINLQKRRLSLAFFKNRQTCSGDKDDKLFGSVLKEALEDLLVQRHMVHNQTSKDSAVHCIKHQRDLHAFSALYMSYCTGSGKYSYRPFGNMACHSCAFSITAATFLS